MQNVKVWDPLVRIFHWSLVAAFTANALFTDPEEDLHETIGYIVLALVCVRILWGFIGTRHARFSDFPPSPKAAIGQVGSLLRWKRDPHAGHSPLGALMIYNLLATLLVIVASGWMMTTNTWFGIKWVEELHELAVHWAELSVVLHVLAVVVESRRLGVNLPRSMLTGYKDLPGVRTGKDY